MMEINWKKNAVLFLGGQALSLFGTMLVQYAVLWHITLKSQSGAMITVFSLVGMLPMFFISPFAGVWADRFNRKHIINIADGAIAFFSLLAALFLAAGIDSYIILLLCALVRSLGQGIQAPAVGAFIPQIVPPEHLTRINGLQSSISSFVTLSSPMLGGALMTLAPLQLLFFLDVLTAAVSICIVFFLVKVPARAAQEALPALGGGAYFHDLKAGLQYIRRHGYIWRMIILSALFLFLFAPAALLTPLQVTRNFGPDVWRLAAMEITFSLGMTAGGLLIGIWGGFRNRVHTIALACALCGLLAAALGLAHNFRLYLGIMALLGLAFPLYNAPAVVLLQSTVAPAFMGRIISVFSMVAGATMPLGMLFFGPLADLVSIDALLIATGLPAALLALPVMLSKTLRQAGAKPAPAAVPPSTIDKGGQS